MKNKFFLTLLFLCTTFVFKAQNNNNTRDIRKHPDFIRYLENGKAAPNKAAQVQKSEYSGLDKVLSGFFYYEQMPADFPKVKENMSREEYIQEVNRWLSQNQQRIKSEKQNKFINQNGEEYEKD
jgi:hypothetical protein